MRAIDADALQKEYMHEHDGKRLMLIDVAPTIESRCEACEAFNKTRLLIPQPQRKKGKWIDDLIFDINPAEICAQIEADNLKKWCEIIQTEMKMAMVQLPCWGKDGEEDDKT